MKTDAVDPFGLVGGQEQRALSAERERYERRPLGLRGVHHGEGVVGELGSRRSPLSGRSERPLPRPSKVSTRQWRAR